MGKRDARCGRGPSVAAGFTDQEADSIIAGVFLLFFLPPSSLSSAVFLPSMSLGNSIRATFDEAIDRRPIDGLYRSPAMKIASSGTDWIFRCPPAGKMADALGSTLTASTRYQSIID